MERSAWVQDSLKMCPDTHWCQMCLQIGESIPKTVEICQSLSWVCKHNLPRLHFLRLPLVMRNSQAARPRFSAAPPPTVPSANLAFVTQNTQWIDKHSLSQDLIICLCLEKNLPTTESVVTAWESGVGAWGSVLPYESPQLGIAAPNPAFVESCHHRVPQK